MMPLYLLSLIAVLLVSAGPAAAADADLILPSGKVITADAAFSIAEAVAVMRIAITRKIEPVMTCVGGRVAHSR